MRQVMILGLSVFLSIFLSVSCTSQKNKEKGEVKEKVKEKIEGKKQIKTKGQAVKKPIKKVVTFDIEKNCTICHERPAFKDMKKDYLANKIKEHQKLRRVTITKEQMDYILSLAGKK